MIWLLLCIFYSGIVWHKQNIIFHYWNFLSFGIKKINLTFSLMTSARSDILFFKFLSEKKISMTKKRSGSNFLFNKKKNLLITSVILASSCASFFHVFSAHGRRRRRRMRRRRRPIPKKSHLKIVRKSNIKKPRRADFENRWFWILRKRQKIKRLK